MRQEYRAYPTRKPAKSEAAAEAFCGLYNATLMQRLERLVRREAMFNCLLDSHRLVCVSLFRPRLCGAAFRVEQSVARADLHRAIKALLRLLGARWSHGSGDGPGPAVFGRMGFCGLIRTQGQRLPYKPRCVVLAYWQGGWFVCFAERARLAAYRLASLTMTYRAMVGVH